MPVSFQTDEAFALAMDGNDPLKRFRDQFLIPTHSDGKPTIYFCGNSLGLQPKTVRAMVNQELDGWAEQGIEAHFKTRLPWFTFCQQFRESCARLVGAKPSEVVVMNSLTINLHLMMATFYRPIAGRFKVLMEAPTFPSDLYAVQSQIRHHGFDPLEGLVRIGPEPGEHTIRMEKIETLLHESGAEINLVLLSGVNFFSGQCFNMKRITTIAHQQGCMVGLDLAHAVGNVILNLHDWQADFAAWCSYKYLNGGPGAIGGCFIHEKHAANQKLRRLAGWWGKDPATRFEMQEVPDYVPEANAAGWQVSNPPLLSMVPLRAALDQFDEAGMPALCAKSELQTAYLRFLLGRLPAGRFQIITPSAAGEHGCQISLLVHERPRELLRALMTNGVICDFREPNVLRVAPTPLYNSFREIWEFAGILERMAAS